MDHNKAVGIEQIFGNPHISNDLAGNFLRSLWHCFPIDVGNTVDIGISIRLLEDLTSYLESVYIHLALDYLGRQVLQSTH